ncbi:ABC transporter ATP-binding protein [[Clostridium] fimetarium]|uniref:ABC-2 type transport system ATP-binding protein n=1 Tax=[Clostridium] fimetarium TaxID=99656 RepID=A0A1I0R7H3_9FIRM|nr:ABC transporter ATP-binding protein [[Clostridium] fimetarium]SEW36407.1 ABC-2 type transport system ATP-binding protein [[Clostridium] fimetarium]
MRIEIVEIVKRYKANVVLEDISLTVENGKIYCLLGASGSGKTTLLRIIMGAITGEKGQVLIDGVKMPNKKMLAQIGFMPQEDALYSELSILQNMKFFAGIQNLKKEEIIKSAEKLLQVVGLLSEKNKLVSNCSGGMKKRASLATTMIHNPKILILDEPTVGIDPVLRRKIWAYLHSLRDNGVTILVTTHAMDEVTECDNAALLRNGKIIIADSVVNLLKKTENGKIEDLFFVDEEEESTCFQL